MTTKPSVDVVTAALNGLQLKDKKCSGDAVVAYFAKHAGGGGGGGVGDDSSESDDDSSDGGDVAANPLASDGLLALWQALCLEFGLVQDPANPALNPHLPALPPSKTKARALLNTRAHVSIVDYILARAKTPSPAWGAFAHLVHASAGALAASIRAAAKREKRRRYRLRRRLRLRGMEDGEIADAVRSGSKVFPRELAKSEGLQPLLRKVF